MFGSLNWKLYDDKKDLSRNENFLFTFVNLGEVRLVVSDRNGGVLISRHLPQKYHL